jgi:hypothetical protein
MSVVEVVVVEVVGMDVEEEEVVCLVGMSVGFMEI